MLRVYIRISGPEGSRKLRFPDFMTTAQGGGKVVSHTHRPHLAPGSVYIYIYIYIYVYIHTSICMCVCVCMYVCIHRERERERERERDRKFLAHGLHKVKTCLKK